MEMVSRILLTDYFIIISIILFQRLYITKSKYMLLFLFLQHYFYIMLLKYVSYKINKKV